MSAEEDTLDDLLRALSLAEHDCAVYRYTDGLQVYERDVYRTRLQAVADARAAIRAHVAVSAELREIAALIARDSLPVTASSTTYFVPRYQIYKLRAALESQSAEGKPYGYLREVDGRAELSVGPARPADRAGGYATPWCPIYTKPQPAAEGKAVSGGEALNRRAPAPEQPAAQDGEHIETLRAMLLEHPAPNFTAERAALEAAIAALQRQTADADRVDAERYRWLRKKTCIVAKPGFMSGDTYAAFDILDMPFPTHIAPDPGIELDATIDSARAEGGGS